MKPLEFLGMRHTMLFAFDWTNVKRNFQDYASSISTAQLDDDDILWEGEVVAWSQKPASNYNRPYTFRLSTTHSFNIGRTRWLWNNFFRYREGYRASALVSYGRKNGGRVYNEELYNKDYAHLDQYAGQWLAGAFNWDMRIGFEVNVWRGNTLFLNLDIYNVLDTKARTILTQGYAGTSTRPSIGYELGRQLWIQVGYKY